MKYTPLPNEIIDEHLPDLRPSEVKVLLIVLRQTIGWHKQRDWISISQFVKRTGLSQRAISDAITSLIASNLICVWDKGGQILCHPSERICQDKLYFGYPTAKEKYSTAPEKNYNPPQKNLLLTKETSTKYNTTKERDAGLSHIKDSLGLWDKF